VNCSQQLLPGRENELHVNSYSRFAGLDTSLTAPAGSKKQRTQALWLDADLQDRRGSGGKPCWPSRETGVQRRN
jgi:hypothetical protein